MNFHKILKDIKNSVIKISPEVVIPQTLEIFISSKNKLVDFKGKKVKEIEEYDEQTFNMINMIERDNLLDVLSKEIQGKHIESSDVTDEESMNYYIKYTLLNNVLASIFDIRLLKYEKFKSYGIDIRRDDYKWEGLYEMLERMVYDNVDSYINLLFLTTIYDYEISEVELDSLASFLSLMDTEIHDTKFFIKDLYNSLEIIKGRLLEMEGEYNV